MNITDHLKRQVEASLKRSPIRSLPKSLIDLPPFAPRWQLEAFLKMLETGDQSDGAVQGEIKVVKHRLRDADRKKEHRTT